MRTKRRMIIMMYKEQQREQAREEGETKEGGEYHFLVFLR